MLKVNGVRSENVTVKISETDALDALEQFLRSRFNIRYDAYLNKELELVYDQEYHTSHSWDETKVLDANPSLNQINLLSSLKTIRFLLNEALQAK